VKKCKVGYYYCYTDKKCKKIPVGYRRGLGGYLRKETEEEKKNGNGNGNGNGSNGNGHSSSNGGGNGHSNGSGNGGAAGNGGGMSEAYDTKKIKKIVKQLRKSTKTHKKQADYLEKVSEESNPRIPRKKGQPANSKKHSDLYTDENPKGTIHGLGFKDVAKAKASVTKIRNSSRSHAHKIQAAVAMEQRAREMGKTSEASVYRKYINSMKKKTKKMDEAANPAQQAAIAINMKKRGKKPKSMNEGSLHKWFKGSKSKDGKGGWVNVVTGGTCASDEPGEGTPKCVSSAKRASMSKAERISAARRKKKADPGQQAKSGAAKPTYVSTDSPRKKKMKENYFNWREELQRDEYGDPVGGPKMSKKQIKKNLAANTPDKDHTTDTAEGMAYGLYKGDGKPKGAMSAFGKKKKENPYSIKNKLKMVIKSVAEKERSKAGVTREEAEYIDLPLHVEIPDTDNKFKLGLMFRESLDIDKGMLFIFEEVGQHSFHMKNTRIPLDVAFVKEDGTIESIKELDPYTTLPVSSDGEVLFAIEANRGWFAENNVEVGDEIVLSEVKDKKGKGSGSKDACYHKVKSRYSVWPSAYASGALVKCRKVGAANWGNSRKESVDINNSDGQLIADVTDIVGPNDLKPVTNENGQWVGTKQITEAKKCWPGYEKKGTKIMFGKRYNNCVKKEDYSNWREELNVTEASAAWQRKEGKNKAGGLNEKGRKSYERQNPGSDLKAPSKKVGNPRRASFCARMKGMKKKLTSSKTANDPDSRINKSLRKWNC
jgi:uncharacterized membrane protein (UPF0127 family)